MGSLVCILEYSHKDEVLALYLSFASSTSVLLLRAWTLASCSNLLGSYNKLWGGYKIFARFLPQKCLRARARHRIRPDAKITYLNSRDLKPPPK